jgi:ribose transport system substrate-binding protein
MNNGGKETVMNTRITRRGTVLLGLAFAAAGSAHAQETKNLLWVQYMRDHPVHKLMQAGFLNRCKEIGYHCEVVGNTGANEDVPATIPLAEAALSREKFGAVAVYALDPAMRPFIARLARDGYKVVTWHSIPKQGEVKGLLAATGEDISGAGVNAAIAMGEKLGGHGVVALTEGSFNTEENQKAAAFRATMQAKYPDIKVLEPQLEGFEPSAAKAKAVSILQGHPEVTGAFSTTGNGPQTWAGAARTAGVKIIIIAMDYIRQNLDLVKSGEVYGVVAQPLYEEGAKVADLGAALAEGKEVPYENVLPAKVLTAADLAPYYDLLIAAGQ